MKKIPYEVILMLEAAGSILLAISFYLYYKSIPEPVAPNGELLNQFVELFNIIDGCQTTIFGMLEDWFYQGIKFSKYNSCETSSFISKNFSYIFWIGLVSGVIGSYLHVRYTFLKK